MIIMVVNGYTLQRYERPTNLLKETQKYCLENNLPYNGTVIFENDRITKFYPNMDASEYQNELFWNLGWRGLISRLLLKLVNKIQRGY